MPELAQRTAEVVDLGQRRKTFEEQLRTDLRFTADVHTVSSPTTSNKREATFEDLYSAGTISHALISRSRELLQDGAERIQAAQDLLAIGDEVGADQQVMLLQGVLPELFCCRGISEGSSAFVLALHYALANQRGAPLDGDQIFAIRRGLNFVRENLFLSFDRSLDFIDMLSDSKLVVDPPETAILTDVFTESSTDESAS